MNDSLKNLYQFIQDFSLRQTNGAVYFKAAIVFELGDKKQTRYSEIHIITSDHLGSIYLLNPETELSELPDILDIKFFNFIYMPGQCLRAENREHLLLIFPMVN